MINTALEELESLFRQLKIKVSTEEYAAFAYENQFTEEHVDAILKTFRYLADKKEEATIELILKISRLPLKQPKTFENFRFEDVKGRDIEKLKALPSLSAIHAHKNLAFIGPAGTGKTHLAMAFGYECCKQKLKTYFIKMSELNEIFTNARRFGKESSVMTRLVNPACLILDEVGHCVFDRENTRMFFDLIDRRYNKEGNYNMVFTSNKQPNTWRQNFNEDDSLLCALDRIFDDAMVFNLKGNSQRGKKLETVQLTTVRKAINE